MEAEVLWLATDQLTLGGNFSVTYAEFSADFFIIDGADADIPGDIYDFTNADDRARNINGGRLPQIPESKLSLYGNYEIGLAANGRVNLLANYSYIDEVFFGSFESDFDRAPEYDRIDLRATWTSPSESWVVSGFVNNVTDDVGIRQILRHGVADGYRRTAQVTEPRVVGLELSYTFIN